MMTLDEVDTTNWPAEVHGMPLDRQNIANIKMLLVSTSLKTDVMHCLVGGEELSTKKMGVKLGIHQSSVSHAIKDLLAEDLVVKTANGYKLTNLGTLRINLIDRLKITQESLVQNKDFFLAHDMDDIPINYQMSLGVICSQQERLNDDTSTPYRKQEYLIEHLTSSKEIRCIPSIITTNHVGVIANAIKHGSDVEVIMSDRVLRTFRRNYAHILEEILGHSNLKTYRIKEAKFSLWVTESNLFLGLYRSDGCYDLENILICKSENAIEWGNTLFHHFKKKAKLADGATI